ncbi:MAG: O-methyltransferase [Nitrospirae bacterium]|nr:O-methyltransferase [Nitrospirota bacterium]
MDILHPDIENYLMRLLPARDEILSEMERLSEKKRFPIVGPLVGRLLSQMARTIGSRRVFEFGSGFGYSAYWFLKGMDGQGQVVYTDDEEENARWARGFFQRAGLLSCLQIEMGDALEIIDHQHDSFDIILIDCEKARYPMAYEKAIPRIRKGGLLIADNVLWSGSVIRPSEDPSTVGIQKFNQLILADPQLFTTILPLRDGVSISLKL